MASPSPEVIFKATKEALERHDAQCPFCNTDKGRSETAEILANLKERLGLK